jgi:hypothetical protein
MQENDDAPEVYIAIILAEVFVFVIHPLCHLKIN